MAVVTEAALAEAQNRIKRLEWELEQTRNAMQQAQNGGAQAFGQGQPGGGQQGQRPGFFSSLFGGGGQGARPGYAPGGGQGPGQAPGWGGYQPTSAPPQPQYAPGYQPGMFQRGGVRISGLGADHGGGRGRRYGGGECADERVRGAS